MSSENTDQKGSYPNNVGRDDARHEHGIREKTAESDPNKAGNEKAFDQAREDAASEGDTHGGMGRTETPRDGETEGAWHQPDEQAEDRGI